MILLISFSLSMIALVFGRHLSELMHFIWHRRTGQHKHSKEKQDNDISSSGEDQQTGTTEEKNIGKYTFPLTLVLHVKRSLFFFSLSLLLPLQFIGFCTLDLRCVFSVLSRGSFLQYFSNTRALSGSLYFSVQLALSFGSLSLSITTCFQSFLFLPFW
jgi:hypothetical protein